MSPSSPLRFRWLGLAGVIFLWTAVVRPARLRHQSRAWQQIRVSGSQQDPPLDTGRAPSPSPERGPVDRRELRTAGGMSGLRALVIRVLRTLAARSRDKRRTLNGGPTGRNGEHGNLVWHRLGRTPPRHRPRRRHGQADQQAAHRRRRGRLRPLVDAVGRAWRRTRHAGADRDGDRTRAARRSACRGRLPAVPDQSDGGRSLS